MYYRHIIITLLLLMPMASWSQIVICNHEAAYDKENDVWLATIPETLFGQDDTLMVNGNKQVFHHICADSIYTITETDQNGRALFDVTGKEKKVHIQFTFLPIITLRGDFGYDYQEATVTISDPDAPKDTTYTANIKWRGGTTNAENKHKRNYKIKFNDNVQLFGMRTDNNWMLDAGQADVFRMRNRIAMDLWNDMARKPYYADEKPNARNGVSGRMVELYVNNEYMGIYNLSEFMDRKQMKLKKVDELTGQIHGCMYKGINWDHTQMFYEIPEYDNTKETLYGFEVEYPELNDCDTTEWAPLVKAINFAAVHDEKGFMMHANDYFDLTVMIDYSIFNSIVNAIDNSGKNMFWAVYDKTISQRLTPAPWDLDATFGQRWGGTLVGGEVDITSPAYMTDVDVMAFFYLYKTNLDGFNDQINTRYRELHQPGGVLSTDSIIGRFTYYYNLIKKSGAARRETQKWSGDSDVWGEIIDFDKEYDYICNWVTEHMRIIDETTFPLYYTKEFFEQSTINHPTSNKRHGALYNLKGQRIDNSKDIKPGIYIKNGRKFVVH